jgi:deoxyribonucleoside regulator
MYYKKGMSQQEIANKFNFSKMTLSRLLHKARDQNVVEININMPFQLNSKLACEIVDKYKIEKALVIKKGKSKERIPELIGKVYAFNLGVEISDNYVLGMGVGNTIGQIVQNLPSLKTKGLHIVQLMGGLSDVNFNNPFTIVQETCRKLHATGTYMSSYAAVANKEVRDSLLHNSPMGIRIVELWKKCKEAVFGIGVIEKGTLLSPELVTQEEIYKLKKLGIIGDVLGHCFNQDGEFIHSYLEDRLISIPVDLLKNIRNRVVVAGGEEKVPAIRGALISKIVTILITDEKTAERLL